MPRRAEQWNVVQRFTGLDTSEHQSTPAHVSPTHEFRREHELFPEHSQQRLDIFRRRNATQKNDLTALVTYFRQPPRVTVEQTPIPVISGV